MFSEDAQINLIISDIRKKYPDIEEQVREVERKIALLERIRDYDPYMDEDDSSMLDSIIGDLKDHLVVELTSGLN